jgi:hypothetical protein
MQQKGVCGVEVNMLIIVHEPLQRLPYIWVNLHLGKCFSMQTIQSPKSLLKTLVILEVVPKGSAQNISSPKDSPKRGLLGMWCRS